MSRPLKYNLLWLTILDQEASVYDMNKNTQSYQYPKHKNAIHQNLKIMQVVTNVTPKAIEKETSICHCTEIFKLEHELQGCGMYIAYIYCMKLE